MISPEQQSEFSFCNEGPSLAAPHPEARVTCCRIVPQQRDHAEFHAKCFADEPRCKRLTPGGWPRPNFSRSADQ
jgi:hypothetical protein